MGRVKDVQFSSRPRLVTDQMQRAQHFRNVLRHVLDLLPDDVCKSDEWCKLAEELACSKHYNIVHLIYRHKEYEGYFKDYQFGFSTMREHWASGLEDIRRTLAHLRLAEDAEQRIALRHAGYYPSRRPLNLLPAVQYRRFGRNRVIPRRFV